MLRILIMTLTLTLFLVLNCTGDPNDNEISDEEKALLCLASVLRCQSPERANDGCVESALLLFCLGGSGV